MKTVSAPQLLLFLLTLHFAACSDLLGDVDVPVSGPAADPGRLPAAANLAGAPDDPAAVAETGAQLLPVCLPKAEAVQPAAMPHIEALMHPVCQLHSTQSDATGDGDFETQTVYERYGQVIRARQFLKGKQVGKTLIYTFDEKGRLLQREQRDLLDNLTYHDAQQLDAAGHLLRRETHSFAGSGSKKKEHITTTVQSWDGDLLLSRQRWSTPGNTFQTFNWTYDAHDRLIAGVHRQGLAGEEISRAQWSYDGHGRPVAVARSVRGKPSLEASWRWRSDGHLTGRSVQVHLGVGGINGRIDDYDAPTGSSGAGNCYGCGHSSGGVAWQDAKPEPRDGCRPLPSAVGHGYPERDYALQGDRDSEVKIGGPYSPYLYGYGYNYGYGYGYGGAAWLGHAGPGSNWDALAVYVGHSSAAFDLTYDEGGRMVREHLTVVPTDPKSTAPRKLLRTRTFSVGRLLRDAIFVDDASPTAAVAVRCLDFTRSADGHLTERVIRVGGGVAMRDSWTVSETDKTILHRQFASTKLWQVLGPTALSAPADPPALKEGAKVLRTYRPGGELLELRFMVEQTGDATAPSSYTSHRFDKAGRQVQLTSGLSDAAPTRVESWDYNDVGLLAFHAVTYLDAKLAANGWFERHEYNDAGLPTRLEKGKLPAGAPTWAQTWDYACL